MILGIRSLSIAAGLALVTGLLPGPASAGAMCQRDEARRDALVAAADADATADESASDADATAEPAEATADTTQADDSSDTNQ